MTKLAGQKVILATHNAGKLREIAALLAPYGVSMTSAGELGLPEPEETETTFAGNARIKAHFAAKESGLIALSDDSGIEVDVLNGAPGVYTADWAETGEGRDFLMAMTRTHDEIQAKGASEPTPARFVCTLCLAWPDGTDMVFRGDAEGHFTWPPRGENGFGYDPCFQPLGHDRSFGEMTPEEKEPLTHRADAFRKLVEAVLA
ncbi:RdgB/HAM1 family non-canonical purine NTP pyrophosphatase [Pontivivens insulae]|uniref:dITP/XTP pyrophosphatase n=1 Tax=Pontivivens insulae TaxID=1639689 RepID=A0A2R8A7Q3_9RHOB|nr:RdgB/HAM1 family non-canonical purine NTP pyrophosphatase [Pontivivens insulae]RED18344.1 XTP/dITP diphosphohydrolase [Pontivivens insulae]SPF28242.1 dITP/XTP pyrophosphatase [Pontivivens insulae]